MPHILRANGVDVNMAILHKAMQKIIHATSDSDENGFKVNIRGKPLMCNAVISSYSCDIVEKRYHGLNHKDIARSCARCLVTWGGTIQIMKGSRKHSRHIKNFYTESERLGDQYHHLLKRRKGGEGSVLIPEIGINLDFFSTLKICCRSINRQAIYRETTRSLCSLTIHCICFIIEI